MLPFGRVPRQYAHASGAPWPSDPGETLVRSGVLAITVSRIEWRSARAGTWPPSCRHRDFARRSRWVIVWRPAEADLSIFNSLIHELCACRIVDLASDLGDSPAGPFETRIDVIEAVLGARVFCEKVAPGLVPEAAGKIRPEDFPDSAFLRHEMVSASVHSGSHIDAPGHYGPLGDGSRGHIGDAPLDAFVGPGVLLDVSGVPGWEIEPRHIGM
jgi:hypothetical protein